MNERPAPLRSTLCKGQRYDRIIAAFVADLPGMAADVERLANDGDLERVVKLAHRLKGSAGGYGFAPIMDAAAALEHHARAGDAPRAVQSARALRELCDRAEAITDEPIAS